MSENVLQTTQQFIHDVVAPDLRDLKSRVASLEKEIAALAKHMDVRFNISDDKHDAQFKAIMAAISESRAQAELSSFRVVAALSERVAVLEARHR